MPVLYRLEVVDLSAFGRPDMLPSAGRSLRHAMQVICRVSPADLCPIAAVDVCPITAAEVSLSDQQPGVAVQQQTFDLAHLAGLGQNRN